MATDALSVLNATFGYDQFRGQQGEIVDTVIAGQNALVLMPTGGGKSLCYQIPALVRDGIGVIVSPLIALMADQVTTLKQLGVRAAVLNSTLSLPEQNAVEKAMRNGEIDLVYIAPERLLTERCYALLQQCNIALFGIDEAHCVSQWGHDFRPEYVKLSALTEWFPNVPRIALTATADDTTRQDIIQCLGLQNAPVFISSFDRPNIRYQIAERGNGKQQLLQFIQSQHAGDAGIVYCLSRKKVEETAEWLANQGLPAKPYHAGLNSDVRHANQEAFLQNEGQIIVATIAFGMGIDKPNVRFVAHLDLPGSIEAYYQETGRAGRDGLAANAWMLYGIQDVMNRAQMIARGQSDENRKRIENHKLQTMLGLCELTTCRRQTLLGYFGEADSAPCGNCDTCQTPPETWDATEPARKALSAIYRTEQRFGVGYIVDHLRGKKDERADRFGHTKLSTYGIGKDYSEQEWRGLIRQMIVKNLLWVDHSQYGGLKLSDTCSALLRGEQTLTVRKDRKLIGAKAGKKGKSSSNVKDHQKTLWEALRALRMRFAKEQAVPPYVIFNDATLMEMIETMPSTSDAMLNISGVSEKKLEKYGFAFLKCLSEHEKGTNDSEADTLYAFREGLSVAEIAEKRDMAETTIHTHLFRCAQTGQIHPDSLITISKEERALVEQTIVEHDALGEGRLKPVYEALDKEFDYSVLRLVKLSMSL